MRHVSFSHSMEMQGMPMTVPTEVNVVSNGTAEDLKSALPPKKIMGHDAWRSDYAVKRPGVYQRRGFSRIGATSVFSSSLPRRL